MAFFGKKQENEEIKKDDIVVGKYVTQTFTFKSDHKTTDEYPDLYQQVVNFANEFDMDIVKVSDRRSPGLKTHAISAIFKKS